MIIKEFDSGKAHVKIFSSRKEMGECAGGEIADCIRKLLREKSELNIMFAAAPSQNEVLERLCSEKEIDWSRINAFHMDEYIGISPLHPAGFARFLKDRLFDKLNFKTVNCIDCTAADPEKEARRYSKLLKANKTDICVLGVGENGHIAFNDPGVAKFNDSTYAKTVKLNIQSRIQQVHDGCFEKLEDVPEGAVTVTVPGLISADYLFCTVPCSTKAHAVGKMFREEISENCPAGILRKTPNSYIYLDKYAAEELL